MAVKPTFGFVASRSKKGSLMGNPLDSLTGTIILGLVITVVMILVVNGIGA